MYRRRTQFANRVQVLGFRYLGFRFSTKADVSKKNAEERRRTQFANRVQVLWFRYRRKQFATNKSDSLSLTHTHTYTGVAPLLAPLYPMKLVLFFPCACAWSLLFFPRKKSKKCACFASHLLSLTVSQLLSPRLSTPTSARGLHVLVPHFKFHVFYI